MYKFFSCVGDLGKDVKLFERDNELLRNITLNFFSKSGCGLEYFWYISQNTTEEMKKTVEKFKFILFELYADRWRIV